MITWARQRGQGTVFGRGWLAAAQAWQWEKFGGMGTPQRWQAFWGWTCWGC